MKRTLLFFTCVLASLTMLAQDGLTVGDIQNSGCLWQTRGEDAEPVPTIVLTKEGSVLSVQLLNYESYCATKGFIVKNSMNEGSNGVPSLTVDVYPNGDSEADCICPYNVSFTLRDLETNRFYLDCWWYKGLVELKEGEPMVLEYKVENVTIDGINFRLLKAMHKAMLMDWTTTEKELHIPSEVSYESEAYTVTSISNDAFWHVDHVTKVTVPKTIRSMDFDYDGAIYANPFRECKSLEWIEVEDGCPLFSSVDGVLFAEDKTMLLGYPIAAPSETYTVPESVTNIRSGAFYHNMYLRKLVIPEEVTYLGWHLFDDTKSLEELYIKGVLEPGCMDGLFDGMDTNVAVYVQPSEVEKFKAIYKGPVYPLPEKIFDDIVYRPMIEDGKVWKVGYGSDNPIQFVEYYYFDSDTIIDGKTCKQMMCQRYITPDYADYEVVMRFPLLRSSGIWYEEDKKVYVYNTTDKQFKLMYDFSVDDNAPLQIHGQSYVIGPKQSGGIKGFKGVYRDVMMLWDEEQNIYNTTWLEGVGGIEGPKFNVYLGEEYHGGAFLMSCTVGDEVIYLNDEYEDGATPAEARKRRIDFTHTIKIQPKARIKQEESEACINSSERDVARPKVKALMRNGTEESMYGEYNDQQLCINLDPLDDAYQVRITSESGKAVYEKDINAGSIVGLNIDISTYAKGHYTVTVENSSESFTGEFGAGNADANGDGGVNVADVDFVIEHIGEALDAKNKAVDVNSDGEINVADVDYIIERIK